MSFDPSRNYALFFDIDATLFFNGKISAENVYQLTRASEKGNLLFINTGRSRAHCPDEVINCGVRWDGILCGSSYAEYHGEVIVNDFIPKRTICDVAAYALKNGLQLFIEGDRENAGVNFSLGENIVITDISDFEKSELSERTTKFFICGDHDKDKLGKMFPDLSFLFNGFGTEGIILGHDKGTIIKECERMLGIPHSRTIAFGDSQNDIGAFRYAAQSVLIDSEFCTLKGYNATYTVDGYGPDAVARFLEKYING